MRPTAAMNACNIVRIVRITAAPGLTGGIVKSEIDCGKTVSKEILVIRNGLWTRTLRFLTDYQSQNQSSIIFQPQPGIIKE